jgi:hypothetical protein
MAMYTTSVIPAINGIPTSHLPLVLLNVLESKNVANHVKVKKYTPMDRPNFTGLLHTDMPFNVLSSKSPTTKQNTMSAKLNKAARYQKI